MCCLAEAVVQGNGGVQVLGQPCTRRREGQLEEG